MMIEGGIVTLAALAFAPPELASEGELRQSSWNGVLDPARCSAPFAHGRAATSGRRT